MKFSYKFSNLLGTVYNRGNILFTPDGNSVISPVGNRITIYDLKNNKSSTLPVESRFNFTAVDLSPNGGTLVAINDRGECLVISMVSRVLVHRYKFRQTVCCVKFSPNGKYFAACKLNNVFIFKAPGQFVGEFNAFVMERVIHDAFDETTCVEWSSDSRVLAVGSKDTTTRLYCMDKSSKFRTISLGAHADPIVAVFFEKNSLDVTTIARNGRLCVWESSMELSDLLPEEETPNKKLKDKDENDDDDIDLTKGEERTSALQERNNDNVSEEEAKSNAKLIYKLLARHYLRDLVKGQNITLTAAVYHKDTHILVTGFSNGSFFVHELPEVNLIHSLSISDNAISTLAINNTGDWLGIACQEKGQLLVWEWQSETYVMKQQGHSQAMSCLAYSHDAQYIVTGGEDGKVKLWNTQSGFCFVTFSEHTSAVTAVRFANNRKFLVSASLDGTVRAYDMTRYRNFRTFVSPKPVQFSSLALESTGEFVAAGGQDVFEIYLWSMKLGRLVEVLSGHEGPVVSLDFSPSLASTMLASVSWDKTLKIWDAVERGSSCESIHLESDGLFVTFNPDGNEVAVATLNGKITMFDVKTATQTSSIDGRIDLSSGRLETDLITAKKSLEGKGFNSLCYSADGQYILAGGQSKNICIYNVQESILVKKLEVTQNRSFDAVNDFIDRRKMTEFGNAALIEKREQLEGGNKTISLPGVKSGDMAARAIKPEIRIYSLQFSPTGQAWAAVSTEGLLIYSLDGANFFDPFQLDISITPESIHQTLYQQEYSKALMMSLRLNEQFLIQEVVESVPPKNIELCVATLPEVYAEKVLKFLAVTLESTKHIEFYLLWIQNLITTKHRPPMTTLLALQKNLSMKYQDLSKICDFNKYTLDFLTDLGHLRSKPQKGNDTQEELLMEIDNS